MNTFLVYNPVRCDGIVVAGHLPAQVGTFELIPALHFNGLPDRVRDGVIYYAGLKLSDEDRGSWSKVYNSTIINLFPDKPKGPSLLRRIINRFKKEL